MLFEFVLTFVTSTFMRVKANFSKSLFDKVFDEVIEQGYSSMLVITSASGEVIDLNKGISLIVAQFKCDDWDTLSSMQRRRRYQRCVKALKGLVLLALNSRRGRQTPVEEYWGEHTSVLLAKIIPATFVRAERATAFHTLVAIPMATADLATVMFNDRVYALEHHTGTLKSRSAIQKIKLDDGTHKFIPLRSSRVESVNPGHAKGMGWHLEGAQRITYDGSLFSVVYNLATEAFMSSVNKGDVNMLDDGSLKVLLAKQKDFMAGGHPNCEKTVCHVHRSYATGDVILNAYSTKLIRAVLEDTTNIKGTWTDYRLGVLLAYADLTGIKEATWERTLTKAEAKLKAAAKGFDLNAPTPVMEEPEEILAFRIVREYVRNLDDIKTDTKFHWSVPVEFDQHASAFMYAAALCGNTWMLRSTGAVKGVKDTPKRHERKDFYSSIVNIEPWHNGEKASYEKSFLRNVIKPIATQLVYGKGTSTAGGRIPALEIISKDKWCIGHVMPNVHNGVFDDPALAEFVNAVYTACERLQVIRWFRDIVTVASKHFDATKQQAVWLNLGDGERIRVETKRLMEQRDPESGSNVVAYEYVTKTQSMPKYSTKMGSWIWAPQSVACPTYVMPVFSELGRRMPTAVVHHQDAVTMDMIVATIRAHGGFAISVHDAVVTNPLFFRIVEKMMKERLWEVYSHRHVIMAEFFASFGATYDRKVFVVPDDIELTRADFMEGHPLK